MKTKTIFHILLAFSGTSWAGEKALITDLNGEVEILFAQPTSNAQMAKFEGKTVYVKKAEPGLEIHNQDTLRAAPNGKARIILEEGSMIEIGYGTLFHFGQTENELRFGQVRFLISPQKKTFKVKTKSTVIGVRGTDFLVRERSESQTDVLVIQGKVEAKSNQAPKEKPLLISSGEILNLETLKKGNKSHLLAKKSLATRDDIHELAINIRFTSQPESNPETQKKITDLKRKALDRLKSESRGKFHMEDGDFDQLNEQWIQNHIEQAPQYENFNSSDADFEVKDELEGKEIFKIYGQNFNYR